MKFSFHNKNYTLNNEIVVPPHYEIVRIHHFLCLCYTNIPKPLE